VNLPTVLLFVSSTIISTPQFIITHLVRFLLLYQLSNDSSETVRVAWRGDSCDFTLSSPARGSGNGSGSGGADSQEWHLMMRPLSSVNMLASLDDSKLCQLMRDNSSCNEDHPLEDTHAHAHDDDDGGVVVTFGESLLRHVYDEIFKKLRFSWTSCPTSGKICVDKHVRSGFLECCGQGNTFFNSALMSSAMWKRLVPHPFDLSIKIDNVCDGSDSSHAAMLKAKQFYKLCVAIDMQSDLMRSFSEKFTHVEVRVVVLNDAMIQHRCTFGSMTTAILSSYDSERQSESGGCCLSSSISATRVVVKGRCRVLIPIAAGASLRHSVDLCCTRNGAYFVHVLARFVDVTHSRQSMWWTRQEPYICTAK
jgi:hypothetical protein